jgi:hypothetical protein
MRPVRITVFVLVGLALGVVGARVSTMTMRTKTKPSSSDATLVASNVKATSNIEAMSHSSSPWTGFTYDHSIPQRELLSTDVRYDPVALSKEEEDLEIKDIFEREPRDPVFAPIMEKRIQAIHDIVFHELRLEDKILNTHIECKTLSCYTAIEVTKSDRWQVYEELSGIMLGDVQVPSLVPDQNPDLSDVVIYNLYRPATRDEAYYKRFLDEAMRPPLEFMKRKYLKDQKDQHEALR